MTKLIAAAIVAALLGGAIGGTLGYRNGRSNCAAIESGRQISCTALVESDTQNRAALLRLEKWASASAASTNAQTQAMYEDLRASKEAWRAEYALTEAESDVMKAYANGETSDGLAEAYRRAAVAVREATARMADLRAADQKYDAVVASTKREASQQK